MEELINKLEKPREGIGMAKNWIMAWQEAGEEIEIITDKRFEPLEQS